MQQWYAEALQEPWREAAHEADVLAAGLVTHDYRSPA
jgi:glutathione S-transferase